MFLRSTDAQIAPLYCAHFNTTFSALDIFSKAIDRQVQIPYAKYFRHKFIDIYAPTLQAKTK